MKNQSKSAFCSLFVCLLISLFLFSCRLYYSNLRPSWGYIKVTTWDALGYYIYLPSIFIYKDITQLKWLPEIDSTYSLSGGKIYQANRQDNGNYVFKYLGGIAILELPFFLSGHLMAYIMGFRPDGFSPPYQWAIALGLILWIVFGIFMLRKLLWVWFDDITVALTILLIVLATNMIQYVSVDSGQSHGWLFPLYTILLFATMKWHEKPSPFWASLAGFIIGLATISRPNEVAMVLIPLLWGTQNREMKREKWNLIKSNKLHIFLFILSGFMAILPQLIYWKFASGSFIFNVGSKWDFLMPHFKVLFGWEKVWFIYTPVTLFFIAGFFLIRRFPFRYSLLIFCLTNIYIIISWHDWKYGGSYSTRALVQSYPVFAFALAAIIQRIRCTKWQYLFYPIGAYLIFLNLFQIWQYNKTILHYYDMNRKYYCHIYLNPKPSPLDLSLLDSKEWIDPGEDFISDTLLKMDTVLPFVIPARSSFMLCKTPGPIFIQNKSNSDRWIKTEALIHIKAGHFGSHLITQIHTSDTIILQKVRLFSPISNIGKESEYAFYMKIPECRTFDTISVCVSSSEKCTGILLKLRLIQYLKYFQ